MKKNQKGEIALLTLAILAATGVLLGSIAAVTTPDTPAENSVQKSVDKPL
jgi:hypothetical protein